MVSRGVVDAVAMATEVKLTCTQLFQNEKRRGACYLVDFGAKRKANNEQLSEVASLYGLLWVGLWLQLFQKDSAYFTQPLTPPPPSDRIYSTVCEWDVELKLR